MSEAKIVPQAKIWLGISKKKWSEGFCESLRYTFFEPISGVPSTYTPRQLIPPPLSESGPHGQINHVRQRLTMQTLE